MLSNNNRLRETMKNNLRRQAQSNVSGFGKCISSAPKAQRGYESAAPARPRIEEGQKGRVLSQERLEAARKIANDRYNARSAYGDYFDRNYNDKNIKCNTETSDDKNAFNNTKSDNCQ